MIEVLRGLLEGRSLRSSRATGPSRSGPFATAELRALTGGSGRKRWAQGAGRCRGARPRSRHSPSSHCFFLTYQDVFFLLYFATLFSA